MLVMLVISAILLLALMIVSGLVTSSYSSVHLAWSYGESMPTARSEVSGVALNNKIYIIGGSDEKGPSDQVNVYDPESNKWSAASALPMKLDHTAAAVHGDKVYVVGGFNSEGAPSDSVLIYDPVTDKWQRGKDMPTARGGLTAQFVNGTLYAIGGDATALYDNRGIYDPQGNVATNEAYNPKTNSWTTESPMPTARDHLTSAVINGNIFVLGGRQPGDGFMYKNLDTNEMYDTRHDKWVSLEPVPTDRSGLASATVNGSIFVFGGESTERTYDNNEKYDPQSNSWTDELPMLTPRHGLAAASIEDKIYVIAGGPKPGGSVDDTNEIFNLG